MWCVSTSSQCAHKKCSPAVFRSLSICVYTIPSHNSRYAARVACGSHGKNDGGRSSCLRCAARRACHGLVGVYTNCLPEAYVALPTTATTSATVYTPWPCHSHPQYTLRQPSPYLFLYLKPPYPLHAV